MRAVLRVLPLLLVVLLFAGAYYRFAEQPAGLKRAPTPVAVVTVAVEVVITRTPDPADRIVVVVTATPPPTAIAPTPTPVINTADLLERYSDEQYSSLGDMPADLLHYYTRNLNEIGDFFDVRPEDLLALIQSQNDGMLRLQHDRPGGIAGISPVAWNGWAYPLNNSYLTDVRLIAQHDGLGFDWRQRTMWEQWVSGTSDSSNLNGAVATPDDLTDSMATLANYLMRSGVTVSAAQQDPTGAATRLAAAIETLQTGTLSGLPPLAESGRTAIVSPPLRTAFNRLLDQTWGVKFSNAELSDTVDRSPVALQVTNGTVSAETAAEQLVEQFTAYYLVENQQRTATGMPLIWPFFSDDNTLRAQRYAVDMIGHPLTPWELQLILRSSSNDRATIESRIGGRADARLFSGARARLDEGLQRTAQGLPVSNVEVAALVQPILQHRTLSRMSSGAVQELLDSIEYQIRALPEFQARHGKLYFAANPLTPWPQSIGLRFGAPADYQPGGRHTGIDVRGQRDAGKQPLLFAVDDGVVAHMGPLFCLGRGVCRGAYAIMLDHGNNVYSIYSHNSEAFVETGDIVTAGQAIGRQGSEGYSRGSHLHFEIHVGAPYTGVWQEPFRGGEFINPLPWLPRDLEEIASGG